MSPEQARGLSVDKRTDIWAFGCVLFEMLTGRAAFDGETVTDTFARILDREPDWSRLPGQTPDSVGRLLERCLQKNAGRRLQTIGDVRTEVNAQTKRTRRVKRSLLWAGATAILLAVMALGASVFWPVEPAAPVAAPSPFKVTFDAGLQVTPSFSPDEKSIVYASSQSGNYDIWMKPIGAGNAVQVTRDPAHDWEPALSPDGSLVAFRSERGTGGLYVVPPTGGFEKRVSTFGFEPQWSPDGTQILFMKSRLLAHGLYTVQLNDAPPRPIDVAQVFKEPGAAIVGWHPDGRRLVFLRNAFQQLSLQTLELKTNEVIRVSVDDGVQQQRRRLRFFRFDPDIADQKLVFAPDGSVIYFAAMLQEILSVWRLDADPLTLKVIGGPHRVTTMTESTAGIAISPSGTKLAFDAGTRNSRIYTLTLDQTGRALIGAPQPHTPESVRGFSPDLTPDGSRMLFILEQPGAATHAHELYHMTMPDGVPKRLVSSDVDIGAENRLAPRWSPDGSRIAYRYQSNRAPGDAATTDATHSIRFMDRETGDEQTLTSPVARNARQYDTVYGWSSDGRFVIQATNRYKLGHSTIALVPLSEKPKGELKAEIVTESTEFNLWNATVSPNARWLCLQAEKPPLLSSKLVVVNRNTGEWTEVTDGTYWDDKPRWASDGRFIYFTSDRGGLWNIWGIAFDPNKGRPMGVPFRLTAFTGLGLQIPPNLEVVELGVGGRRLAIPLSSPVGGIWMFDNLGR